MRTLLKKAADVGLLGLGVDMLARRWHRGRTLVLAYHNIVPRGDSPCGDRSLHLPQSQFVRQLDLLTSTHEIVPVSSLVEPTSTGDSSRPRAAITFDDAYRGALTAGLDELSQRGLPATVFVSPDLLGREAFWWDRIDHSSSQSPKVSPREYALTDLGGRQSQILRWAESEGLLLPPPEAEHARPATLGILRDVASERNITLACHGWRHLNLERSCNGELSLELSRPLDWFENQELPHRRWIAYPYGRHSPRVNERAQQHYSLGFTVESGFTNGNVTDPMRVPRTNVPAGISPRRFQLIISGAMDLLAPGSRT